MTSKIGSGGIENRPAQVGGERSVKRTSANPAPAAPANASGAQSSGVQITDSARQLAALEQAIRTLPEVDDARVATIRAAIANGTYQVSPDRIAEKLLRIEGDLA